ncbi:PREDICTED: phosphatidylglycerol/phosphatidylinositol transfer protein-like [Amphimedon queenslandica]|uniref:MD-2-related lipid-recognition domain-containing protein n=1 Tax=Amphimedon queenslandica TaxID=400682 RepID=A0AAN0JBJ3_AMPQE|nr:PREDICTED: phosphatidylglycerol/phosphatidylinositol transfer protein-like [Amphimedon queenslandica]|eukprot:XP_019854359.1 PREDICTED: phosphatidylglycerol/phosphatidylinositol transfer protein-like [Amphimedon queenslandica]
MMTVLLMILSVVLVVSTLTGSTNNYYNEPTGNKGVTDCSVTKKFAQFFNVSLTSYTLIRGKEFQIHVTFHNKKTIQWGILHFTLTYPYKNYINITFMDEKFNLCDYIDDIFKVYCPMPPGTYHTDSVQTLTKLLWPGKYYAKATAYIEKGEEMMCLMTEFTVK